MERQNLCGPVYEREKDILYIRLPEDFDHYSSRNIKVETEALIEASGIRNIIFDFSRTEFMDSTGIGIILGRYKRMQFAGGNVYVWRINPHIRRMLVAAGILELMEELQ